MKILPFQTPPKFPALTTAINSALVLVAYVPFLILPMGCDAQKGTSESKVTPAPHASPAIAAVTAPTAVLAPLILRGEVVTVSQVPEPGQAPYRECLTFVLYRVLSLEKGSYKDPRILVAHWGMKGGQRLPPAHYRVGEKHRLELAPLSDHPELERVMQADDTGASEYAPYYAQKAE